MTYYFKTIEGDPATLNMRVRGTLDAFDVVAEFTKHPYKSDRLVEEVPFLTLPITVSGADLTLTLTKTQVKTIGTAYFRVRANKPGVEYIIEDGKITYNMLPPKVEVRDGDLYVVDAFNREYEAGTVQGPQGIQGPVGPVGPVGPKGDKGEQGNASTVPGPVGPKGDTGAQGPQGIQGLKGDKGDTGAAGTNGATGPVGPKGDTGAQGIQGIQGLKGDKGDSGDLTASSSGNASATIIIAGADVPITRIRILTVNATVSFGANPSSSIAGTVTYILKQPATGGPYTVTWPATGIAWAGGAPAPVMPTVANSELIVHLFWTGTAWRGFNGGVFYP